MVRAGELICMRCGASCRPDEKGEFARKVWLARGAGAAEPECERFKEKTWVGRHEWRRYSRSVRTGKRHGSGRV
jgi:hypothetical protein